MVFLVYLFVVVAKYFFGVTLPALPKLPFVLIVLLVWCVYDLLLDFN